MEFQRKIGISSTTLRPVKHPLSFARWRVLSLVAKAHAPENISPLFMGQIWSNMIKSSNDGGFYKCRQSPYQVEPDKKNSQKLIWTEVEDIWHLSIRMNIDQLGEVKISVSNSSRQNTYPKFRHLQYGVNRQCRHSSPMGKLPPLLIKWSKPQGNRLSSEKVPQLGISKSFLKQTSN